MSNSGLYAHFGSKQELQLATVEEAGRICAEEVVQPALAAPAGLAQLAAVCEIYVPMQGPSELGTTPDAKLARWDRTAELASIEVPTLVIGARHDTASHGPL
ncbi:MAG TPA: hypothetical protein VMI33_15670 [Streptosporangiaceae bacterium]|nr:hypothetical protein [Streptosporangiaceae bacterium]